jgi:hypothetical protein
LPQSRALPALLLLLLLLLPCAAAAASPISIQEHSVMSCRKLANDIAAFYQTTNAKHTDRGDWPEFHLALSFEIRYLEYSRILPAVQ